MSYKNGKRSTVSITTRNHHICEVSKTPQKPVWASRLGSFHALAFYMKHCDPLLFRSIKKMKGGSQDIIAGHPNYIGRNCIHSLAVGVIQKNTQCRRMNMPASLVVHLQIHFCLHFSPALSCKIKKLLLGETFFKE